ncbi:hypothetical protein BG004_001731 [Podila humilis]|nr:hypothetical protein BG004_001731 [Podila humilis]
MASPAAVVAMSSAQSSKNTQAALRKLMSHPHALNKTLAGLVVRPQSDYVHSWVPVPGVATAKPKSTFTTTTASNTSSSQYTSSSSSLSSSSAPSIMTESGERQRMRWVQSRVSARVLADMRKKAQRLDAAGIALGSHPETGAPITATELLNLPEVKPIGLKTVRMGKPDKGRKHDRTAPARKAKVAKAIAEMPKTIETWKKAKAAEKTKVKSTLPF